MGFTGLIDLECCHGINEPTVVPVKDTGPHFSRHLTSTRQLTSNQTANQPPESSAANNQHMQGLQQSFAVWAPDLQHQLNTAQTVDQMLIIVD